MDIKKKTIESAGPKISPLPNAIIQDDPKNWTALHEAAAAGDEKKLQVLLARNPDRAVRESNNGNTPLHEAAWRGFSRCVKLLCTPNISKPDTKEKKHKGAKATSAKGILASTILDIQNNGGFTALHLAAQNGHNQSCRELLLAGADPDIKNNYGDTPLHTSCRYGHAGATRILISADCDPNKVNLNGDHPLHISCAMGRRKLTRLLLEADCDMSMKNAQGETPRDIAIRKRYEEIVEILNNPQRMRNRREKHKQRSHKSSLPDPTDLNAITWSPYGCHYFPDPRSFPAPKLETLPKEPLKKGEQYYLDLAGHIRKGPVGVGNTCYCGPFFKHIEHKINCNRKSLRRYVHKTKESLDNKVQALAMRTNDQIEQLTRSVIADRVRCESRRLQLHRLLKRGEPLRSTTEHQSRLKRQEHADVSLTRSRSMEFMDRDSAQSSAMSNAKSCGGLLDETLITVHQSNELCSDSDEEDIEAQTAGSISADSIDHSEDEDIIEEYDIDFYKAAESLSKLLEKAKLLNEMKKEPDKKLESESLEQTASSAMQDTVDSARKAVSFVDETHAKDSDQQTEVFQTKSVEGKSRYENISVDALNEVHEAAAIGNGPTFSNLVNEHDARLSTEPAILAPTVHQHESGRNRFFTSLNRNEYTLQNVISALRKDRRESSNQKDFKTTNETEAISEDKLSYKDESNAFLAGNEYIQGLDITAQAPLNKSVNANNPLKWQQRLGSTELTEIVMPELNDPRVSGKIEKVEIKNSEIKLLKKPVDSESVTKRNRVQELVARLQGKLSATQILGHSRKKRVVNESKVSQSESESEDEQNNHNEYKSSVQNTLNADYNATSVVQSAAPRAHITSTNVQPVIQATDIGSPIGIPVHIPLNLPERIIPKDAYFHELPNKKRNPINVRMFSNGPTLTTTMLQGDYVQKRQPYELNQISVLKNQNSTSMQALHSRAPKVSNELYPSNSSIHLAPIGNYLETNLYAGYELPLVGNNYQTTANVNCAPVQNYMQYVERDISNDSGVSTHFYGGQHGPSPSLSPQTYYPSTERLQSPKNFLYTNEMVRPISNHHPATLDPSNVDFTMGNVSSLV